MFVWKYIINTDTNTGQRPLNVSTVATTMHERVKFLNFDCPACGARCDDSCRRSVFVTQTDHCENWTETQVQKVKEVHYNKSTNQNDSSVNLILSCELITWISDGLNVSTLRNVTGADDILVLQTVSTVFLIPLMFLFFPAGHSDAHPQVYINKEIFSTALLRSSKAAHDSKHVQLSFFPPSNPQTSHRHRTDLLDECIKSGFFLLFHRHNVTTVTYTECIYEKMHIILAPTFLRHNLSALTFHMAVKATAVEVWNLLAKSTFCGCNSTSAPSLFHWCAVCINSHRTSVGRLIQWLLLDVLLLCI